MKKSQVKAQRFRRSPGQITVFLSLLLVLFLSFFLSIADAVNIQYAKSTAREISLLSIHSVFGEYQKELLDEYGVFGLDSGYRTSGYSSDEVLSHYKEYLSFQTDPSKDLAALGSTVNWNLTLQSANISAVQLLTDQNGAPFREQISEMMQTMYGIELVQDVLEQEKSWKEIADMEESVLEESQKNETDMQSAQEAKQKQQEEEDLESAAGDTEGAMAADDMSEDTGGTQEEIAELQGVEELKASGILTVLFEHPEQLSGNSIETETLASQRTLQTGYGVQTWQKERNELLDNILFREYILGNTQNLLTEEKAEGKPLAYETEYILFGKENDLDNLEALATRLLLTREAINFAYLCSDAGKLSEAEVLAIAMVGGFGIPLLVSAVKWALVLGWAYCESILDVRTLFAGGKVPLFKSAETWDLPLGELAIFAGEGFRIRRQTDIGFTYADMLRVLLYLGNIDSQTMHLLDLVEGVIRNNEEKPVFYADACIVGMEIQSTWETSRGIQYTFPVIYAYQ